MKLRFFGCGGRDKVHGHNSAFITQGENLLLFDFGIRAARVAYATHVFQRENIKRIFLHFTHNHGDHLSPKGVFSLLEQCGKSGTEIFLLKTGNRTHDSEILRDYSCFSGIPRKSLATARTCEVSREMGLKKIGFEEIFHSVHNSGRRCMAVNLIENSGAKTVFGTDHYDTKFVERVLADPTVVDFYTDVTHLPPNITHDHFPINLLCEMVPPEKRPIITTMHMPAPVVQMVYENGMRPATEDFVLCEPAYTRTTFRHGESRPELFERT